jgi:membrane-bound lytic murein transglycosylase B
MRSLTYSFATLFLTSTLFANYSNCTFKNKNYSDICQTVTRKGVSMQYANEFLLCYFKTQKFDEITWKAIQPSKISYHRAREKKANNALLSYIPKMVQHLHRYKDVYDYAEKKYHVNREVIAAILLKETHLGSLKPKHDAFIVFNTILVRTQPTTPRNKRLITMAKSNMASIIQHCYKGKIAPQECSLKSSYAGAVGYPQFMPNSFTYAKSYKGKVADLNRMEDAIVSVANFLNTKADFTTLIDWKDFQGIDQIEQAWYDYEFTHKDSSFVYAQSRSGKKYNCFSCDKPQLATIKKYVKKIMRYNNSSNYAVGVLRLAYEAHKQIK